MLPGAHIIISNGFVLNFTQNPISGFLLGAIVHHLSDAIPHLDFNIFKNYNEITIKNLPKNLKILLIIEFLIGFTFSLLYFVYFFKKPFILFLFVSLGTILPDLVTLFFNSAYEKYKLGRIYINFHKKFHYKLKNDEIKNIILIGTIEILVILLSIAIFNMSNKFT